MWCQRGHQYQREAAAGNQATMIISKETKNRANCSLKVCEIESCSWNDGKDGNLWDEEAKGGWRADRGSEGDGVER